MPEPMTDRNSARPFRRRLRSRGVAGVVLLLLGVAAVPARADVTVFVGAAGSPETRRNLGFAVGAGLLIVGFEFEYAQTDEDEYVDEQDRLAFAPGVRTFMGNVLVQTPTTGIQLYGTVGAGIFRESIEAADYSETSFATNVGGGVKIGLIGPLRLRLDYRVFRFQGSPLYETPQRFYAGLNLNF